jgi:molecular chaperone GrpE (heat shock protein)
MSVNQGRRVALTIPDDLDHLLDRLCAVQKRKKTQIITELLKEFQPVLGQVADALEAIEQKKDPTQFLNALSHDSLKKIGELGQVMSEVHALNTKKCADTLELPL